MSPATGTMFISEAALRLGLSHLQTANCCSLPTKDLSETVIKSEVDSSAY